MLRSAAVQVEHDASFTEFVQSRQTHLRRVAFAICGDWQRADDILQTALMRLYGAWTRVRRDGREEAYVRQIIVRTNIDESRRPWRREVSVEVPQDGVAPAGRNPEDRTVLFAALQELSVMQRKVVVLRYWLELSVAETAAELGIAEGTVKSHASRGVENLRAALSEFSKSSAP